MKLALAFRMLCHLTGTIFIYSIWNRENVLSLYVWYIVITSSIHSLLYRENITLSFEGSEIHTKKRSSVFFCTALGVHDSYLLIRPSETLTRYVSPNWALHNTSEKMRISKGPMYVVQLCRMYKLTTGLRIELLKDTKSVLGFWCKILNQDIETRRSQRQDLK